MSFTCEKCDANFKSKSDYNRHINKKIPCGKEEKEQYLIQKRTCEFCEVLYADNCSVKQHMKICPLRPNETEKLEQIIAQLSNQISEQNNKLNDFMSQQIKSPTVQNIQNIQNIIQNNIVVTAFGKEDLSFLTKKDYTRILNKGCYSIPELLKLIHCNDNRPEY